MKFRELKQYADIRNQLDSMKECLKKAFLNSAALYDSRKNQCIEQVMTDYSEFFKDSGFTIERVESQCIASYKMITVKLKAEDPGRREEDIPCILRFRMTVSAVQDETYSIFVQTENNVEKPRVNGTADMTPSEQALVKLLPELNTFDTALSELLTSSIQVKNEMHDLQTIEGITQVIAEIEEQSNKLKAEIDQWHEAVKGNYIFLVAKDQDDWQKKISACYRSFLGFLESIDKGNI